jgi:hypothetical protein
VVVHASDKGLLIADGTMECCYFEIGIKQWLMLGFMLGSDSATHGRVIRGGLQPPGPEISGLQ